jgi:hypothetical protein
VLLFIIFVAALFLYSRMGSSDDLWKVYGSMDCGWTRKQVEELKTKGIPYIFMGCPGNECKNGMPFNVRPGGTTQVGFTSVG